MFDASVSQWNDINYSMRVANVKGLKVVMFEELRTMRIKVTIFEDGRDEALIVKHFDRYESFGCAQWILRVAVDYGRWK